MAKRTPNAYLPRARAGRVLPFGGYRGLDRRNDVQEGYLKKACGVDPRHLPALCAAPAPVDSGMAVPGTPLSLHYVAGDFYALSLVGGERTLTRFRAGDMQSIPLTGDATHAGGSVLRFTRYAEPGSPLTSYAYQKAVLFPDRVYCRTDQEELVAEELNRGSGFSPALTHACVHLSRVFGVKGDQLYASGFNSAGGWVYDSPDDISAAHAWMTTSQSNARTAGNFTGITVYGGQVLGFKAGAVLAVTGTHNPFRLSELLSVGAADGRSIAEVGGELFFAGEGQVYRYNGDTVMEIGDPLAIGDFNGCVATALPGLYFLYVPKTKETFLYSTETGAWAEVSLPPSVSMTNDGQHAYFLAEDGHVYTTRGAVPVGFMAEAAPLIPGTDIPFRMTRLRATVRAERGGTLDIAYCDSTGRRYPMLSHVGTGGTRREVSRTLTAADFGGCLAFFGAGDVCLHGTEAVIDTAAES